MTWIAVHVRGAAPAERDAVAAALIGGGAPGVHEQGDALLTFVPSGSDLRALTAAVGRASETAVLECAAAADVESIIPWSADVGVQRVGGLSVAPPWLAHEAGAQERAVIIEPAMAFGTGEHATTRGVLRLMQTVVRRGDVVADVGTGSAVLAIAAAKLGAARVAAIEIDPDAIGNATENVARNGVGSRVIVMEGDAAVLLPLVAPVRVVLANIISGVILALLPMIGAALTADGRAIISGIPLDERDAMLARLERDRWTVERDDAESEWWSCVIAPRR